MRILLRFTVNHALLPCQTRDVVRWKHLWEFDIILLLSRLPFSCRHFHQNEQTVLYRTILYPLPFIALQIQFHSESSFISLKYFKRISENL